jgi:hypothetical protein
MASQKGGKSGALDAFWDTVSSPSTTSGSMSDLLSSLPGDQSFRKAAQKKERPPEAPEPKNDPIMILLKALLSSTTNQLTVVQIMKLTGFGPTECLEITTKAAHLGLVAQNAQNPEQVGYRLTEAGLEFARGTPA